jgi:hypothetical protein
MTIQMKPKDLTPEEKHLIKELRSIEYGNITVYVQKGKAVRIEEKTISIQLDKDFTSELWP